MPDSRHPAQLMLRGQALPVLPPLSDGKVSLTPATPAGHLRPGGPRHDNDHVDFRSIRVAPTCQEVLSGELPYLPLNRWACPPSGGLAACKQAGVADGLLIIVRGQQQCCSRVPALQGQRHCTCY